MICCRVNNNNKRARRNRVDDGGPFEQTVQEQINYAREMCFVQIIFAKRLSLKTNMKLTLANTKFGP